MKLFKKSLLAFLLILPLLFFTACGGDFAPEKKICTVQYIVATGGYVYGERLQKVGLGKDGAEVTALPLEGYEFVEWSDGNIKPVRQEKNVQKSKTYYPIFQRKGIQVKYRAAEGGTIEGQQNQSVKLNESSAKVTALATEGYSFARWSDGYNQCERYETNVTEPMELTAIFEKKIYKIEYYIYDTYEEMIYQYVYHGEDAQPVEAFPRVNTVFLKWSDGVTGRVRQDKNVTQDLQISAYFEYWYSINYYATEGGRIEGETSQLINDEHPPTAVKAIPNIGYKFKGWYDSPDALNRISDYEYNVDLYAIFQKIPTTKKFLR